MQIDGSLSRNLEAARRSAQRLRGRPVHPDTMTFWQSLLTDAHHALADRPRIDIEALARLVVSVESELADRDLHPVKIISVRSSPRPSLL